MSAFQRLKKVKAGNTANFKEILETRAWSQKTTDYVGSIKENVVEKMILKIGDLTCQANTLTLLIKKDKLMY